MTDRVIVLGGYGVFGGYLARALIGRAGIEVLVAGRTLERARAFCKSNGGRPVRLDRAAPDLSAQLGALAPSVVIDAAGPFQAYGADPFALARAAIDCGAHYIDLSDDSAFSARIVELDAQARARGVAVISGASSVPAISSAAVEVLSENFTEILRIRSAILPGNRAPRGLSVVRSILAQAGQPLQIRRGGHVASVPGWSDPRREALRVEGVRPVRVRWASFIGAPDLALFPDRFRARSVEFRAGLELPVLHLGLWGLSFLVRWNLLRSLEPLARPLRFIAALVEPFGSDRGGMVVHVLGRTPRGVCEERSWTLIAEAGDGPEIPTLAARVLCQRALSGDLAPGARPCLGEATLADIIHEAGVLAVRTGTTAEPVIPLFQQALGPKFDRLPERVRALHENVDACRWEGRASVETGTSFLAGLVRRLVGFPARGEAMAVAVEMRREGDAEFWVRDFDGTRFRSEMRLAGPPGSGRITERFGPFRFAIALAATPSALGYPVVRGWFLGVPLPRFLLPRSETVEREEAGTFCFDVCLSLPFLGLMVRYRGDMVARLVDSSSPDDHFGKS